MTMGGEPSARVDGLIIQPLPPDEVLVYDIQRHQAHCLNRPAALVWQGCDGQTSVAEIAEWLQSEMGIDSREAAESAVWVALDRLSRSHLIQEPVTPQALAQGISRREFVRRASAALGTLVALPVVSTVKAATAQAARSCIPPGKCDASTVGRCCNNGRRCAFVGGSNPFNCI